MNKNVLVACEESQEVTRRLREKGYNAFSCDIQECSGGHPEWHIMEDVLPLLNGNCTFRTMDGLEHTIVGEWHTILAFPPCTHLAISGARHFEKKRADGRQLDGIRFFSKFFETNCKRVCVENPVNIIGGNYITDWFPEFAYLPTCTQRIQPYYFGDKSKKTTCLWLNNLPELKPTDIVEPELVTYISKTGHKTTFSADYGIAKSGKARSKTYPGIAQAMVDQWFE